MGVYIPDHVLEAQASLPAKVLFGVVANYARNSGLCWASNATLGRQLGVSGRTIVRWLDELEAAGLVEVSHPSAGVRLIRTLDTDVIPHDKSVTPPLTQMSHKEYKYNSNRSCAAPKKNKRLPKKIAATLDTYRNPP